MCDRVPAGLRHLHEEEEVLPADQHPEISELSDRDGVSFCIDGPVGQQHQRGVGGHEEGEHEHQKYSVADIEGIKYENGLNKTLTKLVKELYNEKQLLGSKELK